MSYWTRTVLSHRLGMDMDLPKTIPSLAVQPQVSILIILQSVYVTLAACILFRGAFTSLLPDLNGEMDAISYKDNLRYCCRPSIDRTSSTDPKTFCSVLLIVVPQKPDQDPWGFSMLLVTPHMTSAQLGMKRKR
jgi:hypothetical protein